VLAVPRDMLIAPYGDGRVNTLRLWEAHSPNDLDMYLFAAGSYVQSLEQRTMAEVITKVLYPADDHIEGKILKTGTAEELAADPMVRKVYLGQHFELKKSHQLTQEMKNRKGQEVNE